MSFAFTDLTAPWTASQVRDLSSSGAFAWPSPSSLVEACDKSEDADDILRIIHGVVTLGTEDLDQKESTASGCGR